MFFATGLHTRTSHSHCSLPFLKDHIHRKNDEQETHHMVPLKLPAFEDEYVDKNKNDQGDCFLQGLQLEQVEGATVAKIPDLVCRNLESIFEQCNQPADEDHTYEAGAFQPFYFAELQMPVPGKRHKHIGYG